MVDSSRWKTCCASLSPNTRGEVIPLMCKQTLVFSNALARSRRVLVSLRGRLCDELLQHMVGVPFCEEFLQDAAVFCCKDSAA